MNSQFVRTGALMELRSYPLWLQDVVGQCAVAKRAVVEHEFVRLMSAGLASTHAMQRFLIGVWPVIEQFPRYMAMNLLKVHYGSAPGHETARRYLIRNIRVEQNHVEHWIDWAQAHGICREQLLSGQIAGVADALSHWCWHTCDHNSLPVAIAATNYAIEGTTGEWAAHVCSSTVYESRFSNNERKRAMKWLRVHAHYDDTHPWEALEIIAMLVGNRASTREIASIQSSIHRSYQYMRMAFDDCIGVNGYSMRYVELPAAAADKVSIALEHEMSWPHK